MFPLRQLMTSGVAIYICTATAFAEEPAGRDIDYDEINDYVAMFSKAKSPLVTGSATVTLKNEALSLNDVEITLVKDGQVMQTIAIEDDGTIQLPAFSEEEAEQYTLHINQPKGDVALAMNYSVAAPDKQQYSYNELFALLDDANYFIDEMAGFGSLFAPEMEALKFEFDEPSSIEIIDKNSSQVFTTDKDGVITLERDDDLAETNPTIIFKHLPKSVTPED